MKSGMEKLDSVVFSLVERLEEGERDAKASEYAKMRGCCEEFREKVKEFVRELVFLTCPEEMDAVLGMVERLIERAVDGDCGPIEPACCAPGLRLENVYRWRRDTIHKNAALEAGIREMKGMVKNIDDEIQWLSRYDTVGGLSVLKQEKWFVRMMGDLYWLVDEMNRKSGEN